MSTDWLRLPHPLTRPPYVNPWGREFPSIPKRAHDDMESGDAAEPAEPASKRPALSTRLNGVNSQDDVMMGDTQNVCSPLPNRSGQLNPSLPCGTHHDCGSDFMGEGDDDSHMSISWLARSTVHEYITPCLGKAQAGVSYWYRMPSTSPQGATLPKQSGGKPMQDMSLLPSQTFFHINEMITAKRSKFRFKHDTMLELFARVVRTGCGSDSPGDFQCFQFEDLFGGQPYLSGFMSFNRAETPLRCESHPFLIAAATEDKCYCLGKLVEDVHAPLGWSILIRDIQPVTWEVIRSVHAHMGK
ncbi:hypothetical protein TARUN_2737 [Trichoderma arundinaceum]|uniref:Uncharacterized protein n=1 Tax=Trichoderma arundinaceum TaxID=490622 RepID=A0A395NTR5_TRIAR|nr:hypothetical protein TARUN_2737 [Trichoderma arundinaceum]